MMPQSLKTMHVYLQESHARGHVTSLVHLQQECVNISPKSEKTSLKLRASLCV